MRVILLERITNFGGFGDIVKVRPGYARNYLLPQGKAMQATPDNLKYFEARRQRLQEISDEAEERAKAMAERLASVKLSVKARADADGKLFGSISVRAIVDAAKGHEIELLPRQVDMPPEKRIRNIGEHEVSLRLHHDITATATVEVLAEEA